MGLVRGGQEQGCWYPVRAEGERVILCRDRPVDGPSGLCASHYERIMGPRREAKPAPTRSR